MDHYPDHQSPNPNDSYPHLHHLNHLIIDPPPTMAAAEFQVSDYLVLDGIYEEEEEDPSMVSSQGMGTSSAKVESGSSSNGYVADNGATSSSMKCKNGVKWKSKVEKGHRFAFRTRSELEVMDDGYKWRKYGKKSVKNSPNPRNYYKCSSTGCFVKKRVERDREDSGYVLTTYDGVHNHQCPGVVYCTQSSPPPPMGLHAWAFEHHSSSSS